MNGSVCHLGLSLHDLQELSGLFIAQAVIMSLCGPPTILLNLLVLVGIYKTPSLHSPSNVLLCGLALTDLGAGAIAMPVIVIESISNIFDTPSLRCVIHIVSRLIVTPFSGVSFVTLSLISVDRLLALHFHMSYSLVVTNCRVVSCLVFVWIAGFVIASSYFWYEQLLKWSSVLIFLTCLIICSFNNLVIFRILRRHKIAIQRQQQQVQENSCENDQNNLVKDRKTSRSMLWVYLLFLACYAPYLVARILRNFKGNNTTALYVTFEVPYDLMYLNSLLNPILYCIKMRSVRNAMLQTLPQSVRLFLQKRTTTLQISAP